MKVNELELYKALKVLTESGYIVTENQIVTENRTFDVEELVTKYKNQIMKLLKQKLMQMLDKVYDGDDVNSMIVIEIPPMMVPVTYRTEPVKMKALTVKLYDKRSEINKDCEAQKGKGKGELYANSPGDTNPDLDPVLMMLNMPIIISHAESLSFNKKNKKKITEGKYTSRKINTIPFPNVRKDSPEKPSNSSQTNTYGRTPERDALYARFNNRYGSNNGFNYYGYDYDDFNIVKFDDHDAFNFKDAVEEVEKYAETPMQVVDLIIEEYFGAFFQEVIHHELTHFIQANNMELDGTENAKDYDAEFVVNTGMYHYDPLEYEAKLHQNLPKYIKAIHKAKNITSIAKEIVTKLFSNQFNKMPPEDQHKYFNEILTLCQVIKTHPEITQYNFNTDKIKKLLRNAL